MSHAVHGAESPPPAGKGRPLDPESPSLDDSPQPKKPRAEDEEESRSGLGGRSPAPGSPHAEAQAAMTSQLQHGTLSQAEEEAEEDWQPF